MYNCVIDFQMAFDTIKHDMILNVFNSFGVDREIARLLQTIYTNSKAAVQVGMRARGLVRAERVSIQAEN